MEVYKCSSPVLFLLFNRSDCTKQVFEAIRIVKPEKFYIAIDGPRRGNTNDVTKIAAVKEVVLNNIDWVCEVKTLIRDTNLGCKEAVSSAINWFFSNEAEGIILEDDCLPNVSFFRFCDTLLEKYRDDDRVRHISGVNFMDSDNKVAESYYFSKITHVWGWASWRRVWKEYDKDLLLLDKFINNKRLLDIYPDKRIMSKLVEDYRRVKSGKQGTWDFQYQFANFINNALCIIPRESLVINIGFGSESTHEHLNKWEESEIKEIGEITHPVFFIPYMQLDMVFFRKMNSVSFKDKVKFKISRFFLKK